MKMYLLHSHVKYRAQQWITEFCWKKKGGIKTHFWVFPSKLKLFCKSIYCNISGNWVKPTNSTFNGKHALPLCRNRCHKARPRHCAQCKQPCAKGATMGLTLFSWEPTCSEVKATVCQLCCHPRGLALHLTHPKWLMREYDIYCQKQTHSRNNYWCETLSDAKTLNLNFYYSYPRNLQEYTVHI